MRRKDREITDPAELEAILRRGRIVRLAMCRDNAPHIAVLSYGYRDGALHLHSAPVGFKMELMRANPQVAFEVTLDAEVLPAAKACDYTARYRSVVGHGRIEFVEAPEAKVEGLQVIMEQHGQGPWEFPPKVVTATAVLKLVISDMTGKRSPA